MIELTHANLRAGDLIGFEVSAEGTRGAGHWRIFKVTDANRHAAYVRIVAAEPNFSQAAIQADNERGPTLIHNLYRHEYPWHWAPASFYEQRGLYERLSEQINAGKVHEIGTLELRVA